LKVLAPGLCTLVVDHGRPRSRSLGVPLGGAADRTALALGNALVGNPPEAAALECSLAGPTLEAGCPLACVVFGAPFELSSSRQLLQAGKTFTLEPGEVLTIAGTSRGTRGYLCIHGGIQAPLVLGSRSSLIPLRAGDLLACLPGRCAVHFLNHPEPVPEEETVCLRVLAGAHAGWFAEEEFYAQTFQASADSNRMGVRLRGRPLTMPARELVSEPVCPGTVQVTRDGQCIILGVDGQTIGGYPRIAQVIAVDLDRLGQLRPGQAVRFERVSLEMAEQSHRQNQAELRLRLLRIRTAIGGQG
jgi:antagonist of KipI